MNFGTAHVPFVLFLALYVAFSLFTIRDFPTVDKTNDDMWNVDWTLTTMHDGVAHQTVNLRDALNDMPFPFNVNTATAVLAFKWAEPSVFTLRVKNLLFGLALVVAVYTFALGYFGDRRWALLAAVSAGMTNAVLYRSHDARGDILAALAFFGVFMLSFRLVTGRDERAIAWVVAALTFLVLLFYKQIHPNGAIAGVVAFGAVMACQPRLFLLWKSWGGFVVGIVLFVVWSVASSAIFTPRIAEAVRADHELTVSDMLVVVPAYAVSSAQSVVAVFKSVLHLISLVVKYPVRFATRIDKMTLTGYLDLLLVGFLPILVAVRLIIRRSLSVEFRFLLVWLVLYVVGMALFCGSSTDYSVYVMPFVIVTLLACMYEIGNMRSWPMLRISYATVILQVVLMVGLIGKVKFVDRYYDRYRALNEMMSRTIPANASVLGAPVYFTMLQPTKDMDYREIFQSAALVDNFRERFFSMEKYDFSDEFRKKRFDFVIYDDFFERVTAIAGFGVGRKSFVDSLLGDYRPVRTIRTRYPASKAMLETVVVYKRIR